MSSKNTNNFGGKAMITRAIKDSFLKLDPKVQVKNPVMFYFNKCFICVRTIWI